MRFALVFVVGIALAIVAIGSIRPAAADLENQVFTSKAERLRLVVPRGWRATDQASYPGLLLWMMRSQPEGRIVVTAEPFSRALYCSWPLACRLNKDALGLRYACALRDRFVKLGMHVGPVQAGPRENEAAGLPSVWFEYDDGKHFVRQAIAYDDERAISVVLGTPTVEARTTHVRSFEQALRTLRPIEGGDTGSPSELGDAGVATRDGGPEAAVVPSASRPAPRLNPIGPCPQQ